MFSPDAFELPRHVKASVVTLISPAIPGHTHDLETKRSLDELKELLRTLELPIEGEYLQRCPELSAATCLGKGKLLEIAEKAKSDGVELLIFDFELTAGQVKNIQKLTKMEVIDRCSVILEIFARHARTREAKVQVEISRLEYLLPRLTSFWGHFGRQKGGIGLKGEGEQQLELDRRMIRRKISQGKKRIKTLEKAKKEQSKKRQENVLTAALVGYTNAGKSSLMNRLCAEGSKKLKEDQSKKQVLEEDKLFATLDATYRALTPDSKPPMVLVDTVGFLSNLPNTLIEGFKSTLASAKEADLLIMVVDLSNDDFPKHIQTTESVLKELGIQDKEIFYVFNKKDLVSQIHRKLIYLKKYPEHFIVSSYNAEDMTSLRESIIEFFLKKWPLFDLFVPFEEGKSHALIEANTHILKRKNYEKGTYYHVRAPEGPFQSLNLNHFLLSPEDPLIST